MMLTGDIARRIPLDFEVSVCSWGGVKQRKNEDAAPTFQKRGGRKGKEGEINL
jgi:hypothetical protein